MAEDATPTDSATTTPTATSGERLASHSVIGDAPPAKARRPRRRRARPAFVPAASLTSLNGAFPKPRRVEAAGKGPRSIRGTRPSRLPGLRWRPKRRIVPRSQRWYRRLGRSLPGVIALIPVLALLASSVTLPALLPAAGFTQSTVDHYGDVPPMGEYNPDLAVRSVILAGDGTVMHTLYKDGDRIEVRLDEVPEMVRNAVLAGEDARFYQHHGIDYRGIARALLANFESREIEQGGSTLTQQLVKLLYVGNELTLERKIREAIYAQELEKRLSKEEILETYLNLAHFGEGVYGIGTAAEHYFSKSLDQLTLSEAAALAATIPAPTRYRPTQPENEERRLLLLDRLEELGWESPATIAEARANPPQINLNERPNRFPYFHTFIRSQLLLDPQFDEVLGPAGSQEREDNVFGGGLRVTTTLLPHHQTHAQRAIDEQLHGIESQGLSGAIASVDPRDGKVLSMASGQEFESSEVNLAMLGRGGIGYQPGSAFKAFFLLAALEQGISPFLRLDAPERVTITRPECPEGWSPGNSDGRATGQINMYEATARSVNTYYAQLANMTGPQAGLEMARRLGINGIPEPGTPEYSNYAVCSLVLGTINVSVLDMAQAYGVLANDGVRCEPYTIWRIQDNESGEILYQHEPECERVLAEDVSRAAVDMLQGGPSYGTGTRAYFGRPLAGKTGTAQDYTSAFFAGFTPQVSSAVWVGAPDQPRPMRTEFHGGRVFGGTFPALVFRDYMSAVHETIPVEDFPPPPSWALVDPFALQECLANQPGVIPVPEDLQEESGNQECEDDEGDDDGEDDDDVVELDFDDIIAPDPGGPPPILPIGVMPDVTGQNSQTAEAALRFLGFEVTVSPVSSPPEQAGIVLDQDPDPGAVLGDQANAVLYVGDGTA